MKPMLNDPEVQRVVDTFQLGLPRNPAAGRMGELLGRGAGSSLEFQEYREYMPGDDIRHLDWGAYARSDTLMVRMYREEISPRTEILVDASLSMNSGNRAKERLARQLSALFALLSGRMGGRPVLLPLQDGPIEPLGLDSLDRLAQLPFTGRTALDELLLGNRVPLRRRAIRIVISDFLFPHDPAALIRRLATDASALWVIQLLTAWEADPPAPGGRKMIDIETGHESDLVIDRSAVATYRARLSAVQDELLKNCRRAHATFATLVADRGLAALCRDELCACGLLRVA
ncbi:MAG: DUF58 domain-containing protein [Planctomycetaceae bacterium]|nr:DUF58 domain-containing protein [Planctomycetaceae bacterium]